MLIRKIKQSISAVNKLSPRLIFFGGKQNILIVSSPRSGSTWLMELLSLEIHCRYVFEPFDIRRESVRSQLGIDSWRELYEIEEKIVEKYDVLKGADLLDGTPKILDLKRWREGVFSKEYSFMVKRIVFKVLHGLYWDIRLIKRETNSSCIFLVRHPISVALSRTVAPRIMSMLDSPSHMKGLSDYQLSRIAQIMDEGDELKIRILEWSLQNRVILSQHAEISVILTYEQLKSQPLQVMSLLKSKFDIDKNYNQSDVIRASSTANINHGAKGIRVSKIVGKNLLKWRNEISIQREAILLGISLDFGIDVYCQGEVFINSKYLLM